MSDAIDKIAGVIERPAGYFTATEFAARTKRAVRTAHDQLAKLYREGKLVRVTIIEDGHSVFVYGLPDDGPNSTSGNAE
jgi:hypothetical protein